MNDLISIIIPIYNVEKYLDKCIESIVNQTYKNLEIILVDDGSSDNCPQICDEWAKKDKRIKVIHKKNGGVSSARNVGLDNARGKYIGFVDSDDYCEDDMYNKLITNLKKYNSELATCGIYLYNNNKDIKENKYLYQNVETNKEYMNKISFKPDVTLWNKIFISEIIGNMRFDNSISVTEDAVFLYQYLNKIKTVAYINECLYYYRISNNSSILHEKDYKKIITSIKGQFLINKILKENNLLLYKTKICDSICNFVLYRYHINEDFDFSEYEIIINNYLKEGILKEKIGIKNKIKVILAVYIPNIYILYRKVKNENK